MVGASGAGDAITGVFATAGADSVKLGRWIVTPSSSAILEASLAAAGVPQGRRS